LASGSRDGAVLLWDLRGNNIRQTLTRQGDALNGVAFSPDGKILASGSCGQRTGPYDCAQGQIVLWDLSSRSLKGQWLSLEMQNLRGAVLGVDNGFQGVPLDGAESIVMITLPFAWPSPR
jgi:WD40 repeat protein